ncbi:MAG: hypothetical protein Q4B60_07585 [Erysipelotrichaceae bacterium]|nr:hypothetical protein [Erysipelotrichaceae bacterium]
MIKVYTAPQICKDCRKLEKLIEKRNLQVERVNIIENTANLKTYLAYRDISLDFIPVKEEGKIGIPFFERENGTITFNVNEALYWMHQPPLEAGELEDDEEEACDACSLKY